MKKFLKLFSLAMLFSPFIALAEPYSPTVISFDPTQLVSSQTKLGTTNPVAIVSYIINWGLTLLGLLFLVLIIYGGFLWMTAGGEEEKITKAKKILSSSVIGLIIVLASYGVAYYVFNVLMLVTTTP